MLVERASRRVVAIDLDELFRTNTTASVQNDNQLPLGAASPELERIIQLQKAGHKVVLLTRETNSTSSAQLPFHADAILTDVGTLEAGLAAVSARFGVPAEAIEHLPFAPTEIRKPTFEEEVEQPAIKQLKAAIEPSSEFIWAQEMFAESLQAHQRLLERGPEVLVTMAMALCECFSIGGKVLFCGNGGSAADAQHAAAELIGRLRRERRALPALALSADTSVLTCIANDWEYAEIFSRQVEALARPGDVVVGLSTSGRSENVARALSKAKEVGARAFALTGASGRAVGLEAELCFCVPAESAERVQELHILALHTLCSLIERRLIG